MEIVQILVEEVIDWPKTVASQLSHRSLIRITSYLYNFHSSLEQYLPSYTTLNTKRNRDTQCHHSVNFVSRDI